MGEERYGIYAGKRGHGTSESQSILDPKFNDHIQVVAGQPRCLNCGVAAVPGYNIHDLLFRKAVPGDGSVHNKDHGRCNYRSPVQNKEKERHGEGNQQSDLG